MQDKVPDRLREALAARGLGSDAGLEVKSSRSLASSTTLRIGGPAEIWARVSDDHALSNLLAAAAELELAWTMVGQHKIFGSSL